MHFGFFYLAEYLNMFVVASVASKSEAKRS